MIILKAETNRLFETNGLPELSIEFVLGMLRIVTRECGDTVVPISELHTGRKLTKQERLVVVDEIVQPFITKHKAELLEYVKTKREVKKVVLEREEEVLRLNALTDNTSIDVSMGTRFTINFWSIGRPQESFQGADCTYTENGVSLDRMSLEMAHKFMTRVDLFVPRLKRLMSILDRVKVVETKHGNVKDKLQLTCN